ncbi:MAG: fluoride efflux transporter CrcB [Pseudoflavonifractor sp.]|nr:fluoride efflux transporter CrcB [Alloprevotella sp.]MCM1116227.1 fluoride efflux transporter CrcB [Pseudoflavonifractor sp.]
MLKAFLSIFLGGGIGSVLRYAVQLLMHERITAYNFPWATFTVNIVGSFLIGLFYALSDRLNLPHETRLLLTAGLCGGFTTFSTLSNDTLLMLRHGEWALCLIYIALSVTLGAGVCLLGAMAGEPARPA